MQRSPVCSHRAGTLAGICGYSAVGDHLEKLESPNFSLCSLFLVHGIGTPENSTFHSKAKVDFQLLSVPAEAGEIKTIFTLPRAVRATVFVVTE